MYKFGDVVWVEFSNNSVGHEFKGKRPAVVVQSDLQLKKTNTITIMPLTGNLDNKLLDDILVIKNLENHLFCDSIIKVYYIMSFDKDRFIKKIGILDSIVLRQIKDYLKKHFEI